MTSQNILQTTQLIENQNYIKGKLILNHTAIFNLLHILPEHKIQLQQNNQLETLACANNTLQCQCPNPKCLPTLSKRIQLLLQTSHLQHTQQILLPFQRIQDDTLMRRKPPALFQYFPEDDTPSISELNPKKKTNGTHNTNTETGGNNLNNHETLKQGLTGNNHKNDYNPNNGANIGRVSEREKSLLINLAKKGLGGEVVRGERLSAKETLRRALWQSGSQADDKVKVPRVWVFWVPRGFEKMVWPYRIMRANFDGLDWLIRQGERVVIPPPPGFHGGV